MAIGNTGSGKSTLLNYLAQKILFKSGKSVLDCFVCDCLYNPGRPKGRGVTYRLDIKENKNGEKFIDTPGLADKSLRKQAGEAISTALKAGGAYKVFFVITNIDGRFEPQDLTIMKLVLDAIPEMKNNYGIVVNKVSKEIAQ